MPKGKKGFQIGNTFGKGLANKKKSEEHKRNISISQIGRIPWNKGIKKRFNTGRTHFKKGQKPWNFNLREEEFKKHYPNGIKGGAKVGHTITEETKRKIGLANAISNKGKHPSEETRRKMSENNKGAKGSNWQGGKSFEPYSADWTDNLKESIRIRDNFTCQECGIHQDELDRKLDVHHINYNKKNLNPNNLISLCRTCHTKTNYNREKWEKYFKN